MLKYIQENPATLAAFMSAIAACLSVIAAWQGPQSAARLSEKIRRESDRNTEIRRMKLQVFSTLMQERATIASIDSVRMLNSIDFVFSNSTSVREAWAELYSIFQTPEGPHPQLQIDKLRNLLREMAADLGMSQELKVGDISRIYYPNALAQEDELRMIRAQREILQIRSSSTQPGAQIKNDPNPEYFKKFPPIPDEFNKRS